MTKYPMVLEKKEFISRFIIVIIILSQRRKPVCRQGRQDFFYFKPQTTNYKLTTVSTLQASAFALNIGFVTLQTSLKSLLVLYFSKSVSLFQRL